MRPDPSTLARVARIELVSVPVLLTAGFLLMLLVYSARIDSIGGDQLVYHQLAMNLLDGNGFSQCAEPPHRPSISRTPAYPLLLAGVYALFGVGNFEAVRVIQILLMTLSALFVFLTARRVFGSRLIAHASLALCCLYPFAYYTGTGIYGYLLTEALTIFSINGAVLCAVLLLKTSRVRWACLMGIFLALALMTRPANIFLPLLFSALLLVLRPGRCMLQRSILAIVIVTVVVAPWAIRNYVQTGRFIVLSASLSGLSLFSGAVIRDVDFIPYPESDFSGNHVTIPESDIEPARQALRGLYSIFGFGGHGGTEMFRHDDELKAIGLEIIRRDYVAFLGKWFGRILAHWHMGDLANWLGGVSPPTHIAKTLAKAVAVLFCLVPVLRHWRSGPLWMILLFPIYNTLIYTPFTPQSRYALPAQGFVLILFAAAACGSVRWLGARVAEKRRVRRNPVAITDAAPAREQTSLFHTADIS